MKNNKNDSQIVTQSILELLGESHDLALLPEIAKELETELAKSAGTNEAVVTGAVAIPDDKKKEIEKSVEKIMPKPVPFVYRVDSSLLGGFTVKIGNWFLDASIRHELYELKQSLQS